MALGATMAVVVVLVAMAALARGQEIIASGGDVTIVVEDGREVGYQIGDKMVKFSEMPEKWSNYTDAGNKGILEALRFGHGIGAAEANVSGMAADMVTYLKNSVDSRLVALSDYVMAANVSNNGEIIALWKATWGLEAAKVTTNGVIGQVSQGLEQVNVSLASASAKSASDLATAQATLMAADSAFTSRMSRLEAASSTTVAAQAATIAALTTTINDMKTAATAVSTAVSAQSAEIRTKMSGRKLMWSGWCSNMGGGSWVEYCHNTHEFGALESTGYIARIGSSNFKTLIAGYYRINFWCISNGGHVHTQFYVNGALRMMGHAYASGTWDDNFVDIAWPFNAGDTFFIQVYGSPYAYHSGSASGQWSRMQIEYTGTVA